MIYLKYLIINPKKEINENINLTIFSMNMFIYKWFKNENYESCKDLLKKTYNKINKYIIDLEKKIKKYQNIKKTYHKN